MANVLFKRGVYANLPATKQDGTFYLTTDTGRLYVDIGNERKLLNQTVQFIASLQALETLETGWSTAEKIAHVNDLYYITGNNTPENPGNILAVYTSSGWRQINPDTNTTVTNVDLEASAANGVITLTSTVTDSDSNPVSGSTEISASGSVHLSATNNGFEISGDKYSLGDTVANDNRSATLTLTSTSGVAADNSSVQLRNADGNVTFTSEQAGILVAVKDTTLVNGSSGASVTVNNGTVSIGVSDTDSNTASGSVSNVGIILNDGSYAQLTTAASGSSSGAIYSKNEIDTKLNGLDGMTYKGTIGSSGATISALPTSGVQNGDTYVIVTAGLDLDSAEFAGATFEANTSSILRSSTNTSGDTTRVGDMVIAKGTETNNVITSGLVWTYVPSGNDSLADVTYSATVDANNHNIELNNANNTTIAKMALVAGTDVALSSAVSTNGTSNNTLTTTINHATYSAVTPAPASSLSNGTTSFTAIKGITLSNGHVTAIETDTFTPITYDISGPVLTQTAQVNGTTNSGTSTVNSAISLSDSNSTSGVYTSVNLNLTSDTIKITGSGSTVTMNLEWGEFGGT